MVKVVFVIALIAAPTVTFIMVPTSGMPCEVLNAQVFVTTFEARRVASRLQRVPTAFFAWEADAEGGHGAVTFIPITPDCTETASIWHEHPPGADEASVYGHNQKNRETRQENPTLKTFLIYTEYQSHEYLQIYRGTVPDDFTVTPIPVSKPP